MKMRWKFPKGYLKIRISGKQIERFMNLCKNRGISLHQLKFLEMEQMECRLSVSDFFLIQQIRRKTHVKIKILKKQGMSFFFHQHKKRRAFFLGFVLCMFVMLLLSKRIWVISIEGNVSNTTPEIMKFLENTGVSHGMKRSEIDCKTVASLLREHYEDITWVAAKLSGSTLTISIKEGVLQEDIYEDAACDLVADKQGTIVKMITRSGVPQKKVGDTCEMGEILVLGRVDITNDEQEVVRYEYVHADADVYIQYTIPYYRQISLQETIEKQTGNQKKSFSLQLGAWYLDFSFKKEKTWKVIKDTRRFRLTESFYLPIYVTKIVATEYVETTRILSEEEAKEKARNELLQYEKNLIQKGVQIFVNNVKIETNHEFCVSYGTLEVIEKIGVENRKDIIK